MQRGDQDYFPSLLHLEPNGPSGLDFVDVYLDSLEDSEISFGNSEGPEGLYTIDEMVTEEEAGEDLDQSVSEDQPSQEDEGLFNFDWIDNSLDQILEIRSNLSKQRNFNRNKRIELDLIGQDLEILKTLRIIDKDMISTGVEHLSKTSLGKYPSTHSEIDSSPQKSTQPQFITAQGGGVKVTRKPVPTVSPKSLIFAPHLPTTLNVAFQSIRPNVTGPIEDEGTEVMPDLTLNLRLPQVLCLPETSTSPQTSSSPLSPDSRKQSIQSDHSSLLYEDFEIKALEIRNSKSDSIRKSIRKSISTPAFRKTIHNKDSELFDLGWDQLEDILENLNQLEHIPSSDWIYTSKIDLIKVKILVRRRSQLKRGNGASKPKLKHI